MKNLFNIPFYTNFLEQFIETISYVSNNFYKPKDNLIIFPHIKIQNTFLKKITLRSKRILPYILTLKNIDQKIHTFNLFCNKINETKIKLVKKCLLEKNNTYMVLILIIEIIKNQNKFYNFKPDLLNSIDKYNILKSINEYYSYQYSKKIINSSENIEKIFLIIIAKLEYHLQSTNTLFKFNSLNYTANQISQNWIKSSIKYIFIMLPEVDESYIKQIIDSLTKHKKAYIFIRGFDKKKYPANVHQIHLNHFLHRNDLNIFSIQDIYKIKTVYYNQITEKVKVFLHSNSIPYLRKMNIVHEININKEVKTLVTIIKKKILNKKSHVLVQTESCEFAKKIENLLELQNIRVNNLICAVSQKSTYLNFFSLISIYINTKKNDYLLLLDILKSHHCRISNKLINMLEIEFFKKLLYRDRIYYYMTLSQLLQNSVFNILLKTDHLCHESKRLLKNPYLRLLDYFKIHLKIFDFCKKKSFNLNFQQSILSIIQKLKFFKYYYYFGFNQYLVIINKFLSLSKKFKNFRFSQSITIVKSFEIRDIQYDTVIYANINEKTFQNDKLNSTYFNKEFRKKNNLRPLNLTLQLIEYDFITSFYHNNLILSYSESSILQNKTSRWLKKLSTIHYINKMSQTYTKKFKNFENKYDLFYIKEYKIRYPKIHINKKPIKISITNIKELLLNPYIYYIKYILKINPLEVVGRKPGNKELGIILHKLMQKILSKFHNTQKEFYNRFIKKFNKNIKNEFIPYEISRFWLSGLNKIINSVYRNFYYNKNYIKYYNEIKGYSNIQIKSRKIVILCVADRIEILRNNKIARIVDFKSGRSTVQNRIICPQLFLEKYVFKNINLNTHLKSIRIVALKYFDISAKIKNEQTVYTNINYINIKTNLQALLGQFLYNEIFFFISQKKILNQKNKNYEHVVRCK